MPLPSEYVIVFRSISQLLDARDAGYGPLAGLDRLDCVSRLRQSGYSDAALAADCRVGAWDLALAALQAAQGVATGATGAAEQRQLQQEAPERQGGLGGRPASGCGWAGAARGASTNGSISSRGVGAVAGSGSGRGSSSGASGGCGGGGESSSGVLLGRGALEHLRGSCAGVMRMRPELDLAPLLLGTFKVGAWVPFAGASGGLPLRRASSPPSCPCAHVEPKGGRGVAESLTNRPPALDATQARTQDAQPAGREAAAAAAAQQPPASPARASRTDACLGPLSPHSAGAGRTLSWRARGQ